MALSPMREDVKGSHLGDNSAAAVMLCVAGYILLSRTVDAITATAPQSMYFPVCLQSRAWLHCSMGFKKL